MRREVHPPLFHLALVVSGFLLTCITSSPALSASFYFELGGGVSQISSGEALFGDAASGSLSYGTALNLTFAIDLTKKRSTIGYHLGLQHRLATGAKDSVYYALQAPYPIIRFDAQRVFLTLGATPFLWQRTKESPGFDGFERANSALSFLLEAGYNMAITPEVSFLITGGGQFVRANGGFGPKPSGELTGGLRFIFGGPKRFAPSSRSFGDGMSRDDYEGFRYPFGEGR